VQAANELMPDENENPNPVVEILSDAEDAARNYDPEIDADGTRDVWWMRWVKFLCIILVLAIIFGLAYLFEYYFTKDQSAKHFIRIANADSTEAMKRRFELGGLVGGGLGFIYVVRCILNKSDP